jgi:hypothetical protein
MYSSLYLAMMGGDGFRGFPVRWQAHLVRIKRDHCETGKNKISRFRAIFRRFARYRRLSVLLDGFWGGRWGVSVAAGDEKSADFWRMWSMVWAATV